MYFSLVIFIISLSTEYLSSFFLGGSCPLSTPSPTPGKTAFVCNGIWEIFAAGPGCTAGCEVVSDRARSREDTLFVLRSKDELAMFTIKITNTSIVNIANDKSKEINEQNSISLFFLWINSM